MTTFRELSDKFIELREGYRKLAKKRDWALTASILAAVPILSEGQSERLREQFIYLATEAGNILGPAPKQQPFEFWLRSVFANLAGHRSKLVSRVGDPKDSNTGQILDVCEASAIYCLRLARAAISKDDRTYTLAEASRGQNNPPKKLARYPKFPKLVYHHANRLEKIVQNKKEEAAYLKQGYQNEPFPAKFTEAGLSVSDAAEAATLDRKIAEARSNAASGNGAARSLAGEQKPRSRSNRGRPQSKEKSNLLKAISQARRDGAQTTEEVITFLARQNPQPPVVAGWRKLHGVRTWQDVQNKINSNSSHELLRNFTKYLSKVQSPARR